MSPMHELALAVPNVDSLLALKREELGPEWGSYCVGASAFSRFIPETSN